MTRSSQQLLGGKGQPSISKRRRTRGCRLGQCRSRLRGSGCWCDSPRHAFPILFGWHPHLCRPCRLSQHTLRVTVTDQSATHEPTGPTSLQVPSLRKQIQILTPGLSGCVSLASQPCGVSDSVSVASACPVTGSRWEVSFPLGSAVPCSVPCFSKEETEA